MTEDSTTPPARPADAAANHDAATAPSRPAPRLLEFLVCPVTKSTLQLSADRTELISRRARLAYPIKDGIPMLTRDTARELSDDELSR